MLGTERPANLNILSTQLCQELYDPAGRLTDPQIAAEHGAEFGEFIFTMHGAELGSPELLPALACDAVESGLDEDSIRERIRVFRAEDLVVPGLQALIERADRQADSVLERIGPNIPEDKRTLVAADYIAQAAYEGKFRKNGNRPYYTHAQEAAAMTLHVFNELEARGFVIEEPFKIAQLCVDLLHDGTEETNRSCKYYDPNRPETFSPLLVRKVFEKTGNPHGRIVANSLRLMTHYAKHPWAPDYYRYGSLGSSDFMFCLGKGADVWHNWKIEPKPITPENRDKVLGKRVLYAAVFELVSISAPQRTTNPKNAAWARGYFDILRSIKSQDVPAMVEALNTYMHGTPATATYDEMSLASSHSG